MRVLITAGPTYEPIDPVRFIGNRSSGQMGAALAQRPRSGAGMPSRSSSARSPRRCPRAPNRPHRRLQLRATCTTPSCASFRSTICSSWPPPSRTFGRSRCNEQKVERGGTLTIELESTEDILAAAGRDQAARPAHDRLQPREARRPRPLARETPPQEADLIVYNPLDTMSSQTIESILLYPDGRSEELPTRAKADFAAILLDRAAALFGEEE